MSNSMEQMNAFPECNNPSESCEIAQRNLLEEKITTSVLVTKKLKKLLKQLNSLCDKKKELLRCCNEIKAESNGEKEKN